MTIHISAKFDGSDLAHHASFNYNCIESYVLTNKELFVNAAIKVLKEKCVNYFLVDFATMCFVEVYYFDKDRKEVNLFRKEKVK